MGEGTRDGLATVPGLGEVRSAVQSLIPAFLPFECLETDVKLGGFDINTCREMISLMDGRIL